MEYTCHTSYGETIEHPYDADTNEPPLNAKLMIVALNEAHAANAIELFQMKLEALRNAIKGGNVTHIAMRIRTFIGYNVKLVNENGRKFTGQLYGNGRGNGLVVINDNGKRRRLEYRQVTSTGENHLPNGTTRIEINYDRNI